MTSTQDKRIHPRAEIFAQVQVSAKDEIYIMSTGNISRGGVFLQGDPAEYPDLTEKATVELVIFATEELVAKDVQLLAQVVRVEPGDGDGQLAGFGLQFVSMGSEQLSALESLLTAVGGERTGPPPLQ